MKKVSTGATKQSRNFSQQRLTIGLDLADGSSWRCVLDDPAHPAETKAEHNSRGSTRGVRGNAAQASISLRRHYNPNRERSDQKESRKAGISCSGFAACPPITYQAVAPM